MPLQFFVRDGRSLFGFGGQDPRNRLFIDFYFRYLGEWVQVTHNVIRRKPLLTPPVYLDEPGERELICEGIGLIKFGTPDKIRTYDLLLRRQTLYPAELRARETQTNDFRTSLVAVPNDTDQFSTERCNRTPSPPADSNERAALGKNGISRFLESR